MSGEVQEWWGGERQSPSAVSHRSQDSGFSDSDATPSTRGTSPPVGTPTPLPRINKRETISPQQKARRAKLLKESGHPNKSWTCPTHREEHYSRKYSSAECLYSQEEEEGVSPRPADVEERDIKSCDEKSKTCWVDSCDVTAKYIGSLEDLDNIPPPVHASTPKATKYKFHHPRSNRPNNKKLQNRNVPVTFWLEEVRYNYEPECMTTLQSKSLTSDLSKQVSIITAVTTTSVRTLQQKTQIISTEFEQLYKLIGTGKFEDINKLVNNLVVHMTELIVECSNGEKELQNGRSGLDTACAGLKAAVAQSQIPNLKSAVKALATAFTQRVDQLLLNQIKRLVGVLENTNSHASLMCALSGISGLGLQAFHLADLLARCSGVTALLSLCINSPSTPVRSAALRTLATVCCTPSSIMQFERGGGVEIMCDILTDVTRGEPEHCEAASVIAQVTAPWLEHGHTVHNLEVHLAPLISALTRLIKDKPSREMLLLCAAALANISWAEPRSVWPLVQFSSVGVLLTAVRRQGPKACVFLREQAATLLANMSAVAEVRQHITQHRAVPALLCFLQVSHSPLQSQAEVGAAYRVQHKSAIALSRLCSEPEVATQVVQLQGISNLARLCREETERNNSDGVLVACLAALRKIAANCGRHFIDELNVKELVDPKLLESFLLYSSRQDHMT